MATKVAASDSSVPLRELLRQAPLPEWVRQMIEHYRRTGTYRSEDLERLLGDPNKRVEVHSDISLNSFLADLQSRTS